MRIRETYLRAALLLTAIMMVGCRDAPTPPEPLETPPTAAAKALFVPSTGVIAMLDTAIQSEYNLQELYTQVIADLGALRPFNRVVDAEGRHVAALSKQYEKYGLAVPAPILNAVPTFEALSAACTEAVAAETANVAMYDAFLVSTDLPERIQSVFESLRESSLDNHLPAFTRCM